MVVVMTPEIRKERRGHVRVSVELFLHWDKDKESAAVLLFAILQD